MCRRVQPLQARAHPMYCWTGAGDITLVSQENISSGEVNKRYRGVTKFTAKEKLPGDSVMLPFCASHPPPEVVLLFLLLWFFDSLQGFLSCHCICLLQEWKVATILPSQPEGIIPLEAEEEDESIPTIPVVEEQGAPRVQWGWHSKALLEQGLGCLIAGDTEGPLV